MTTRRIGGPSSHPVLRLIDANANRALEGLRVCEEIIRLAFNAPDLFRRLRALRHAVAAGLRQLPVASVELVRARNSQRDVGRRAPGSRAASLEHLLLINFQRAKEALRTLEESARLAAPPAAAHFQQVRFRVYDAERDVLLHLAALRHHRSRSACRPRSGGGGRAGHPGRRRRAAIAG